MADTTSASPSPSTSQAAGRAKRFPLDSPQNSAKRQRRRSVVERSQLLAEIQKVQDEIAALKQEQGPEVFGNESDSEDESADVAALEHMLKEMDDGALASLLTNKIAPASLGTLLPYMGDEKMAIVPPATSVGVEGTGSGLQVDQEALLLDQQQGNPTDVDAEAALMGRLERSGELLGHLASFVSIDFHTISSTVPKIDRRDQTRLSRTISIKGRLPKGLGEIKIELEVGEDVEQDTGPHIVTLDVQGGDELFRALGEEHLQGLIRQRDLPAVLLSVRTLLPMAETRMKLFQSVVSAFPHLAQDHLRRDSRLQIVLEGKRKAKATLSILVDPNAMERLSLSNERGARLDIVFAIGFNRWGHAVPNITVQPAFPPSLQLSPFAKEVLEQLPSSFAALCAHAASPLDVGPSIATTIQAFFGLP